MIMEEWTPINIRWARGQFVPEYHILVVLWQPSPAADRLKNKKKGSVVGLAQELGIASRASGGWLFQNNDAL